MPEREVQSSAPSVPERRDRVGQIPDFFKLAWCCIRFHLWLDAPLLEVFFEYLEEAGTDVLTFVGKFLFSVRSRSPAVTAKKTPVKKPPVKKAPVERGEPEVEESAIPSDSHRGIIDKFEALDSHRGSNERSEDLTEKIFDDCSSVAMCKSRWPKIESHPWEVLEFHQDKTFFFGKI